MRAPTLKTYQPAAEQLWLSARIGFPLYFRYSAGSRPNVPRRKARSLINTKKTGTRIST